MNVKAVILIFLLSLLWSCAHRPRINPGELKAQSLTMHPGQVEYVEFEVPNGFESSTFLCQDREISFHQAGTKGSAFLSISYFSDLKPYSCSLKKKDGVSLVVANIKLVKYKFAEEKLKVDKRRVFLSKEDLARVVKERKIVSKIYASSPAYPYFDSNFITPLNSFITSTYGSARLFNNKKRTQHLGIDYRAAVGVPIPSANVGRVVLAEDLFYSGNSVIVDHGMGVFTMYGHMSRVDVSVGDKVLRGQVLGLAGMTGRVTGPHLHWGVKVDDNWVDGKSLVDVTTNKLNAK